VGSSERLDIDGSISSGTTGGIIAWKMALDYRSDPAARDLNAPFRRWRMRAYVFFFMIPFLPDLIFRRWNDAVIEEVFQRACYDPERGVGAESLRIYQEAFARPGVHRAALAYYRAIPRGLRTARADWERPIEIPTLVLWGVADAALPIENTFGLEKHVHDLRIHYVPLAGHFIQEEQPGFVNEQILKFLQEAPPGG
jgi:pimeloyl-ACP methyl ester carboxylesterase